MSFERPAVRVDALSKSYQVYERPEDRLKQYVLPRIPILKKHLHRNYFREFWALRDVSFQIERGETFGIIGRNGAGKSTLLELICGTVKPTSGSIEVNGRVGALLELGAGFNLEFTGLENVYLAASLYGLTRNVVDSRLDDIAAFADIGDFIEQPVKTYSSGMFVRLAFAVVAHIDADILVIDEALAVGDAYFVQKCMRFLRDFARRGTLLFVSHDSNSIVNLCSRALLLHEGVVQMIDSPKAVTERYLESLYEDIQGESAIDRESVSIETDSEEADYRDARADLINNSVLRNDIQVFQFRSDSDGFGTGQARIVSVRLLDENNAPLAWTVGGEPVRLEIHCLALVAIERPIVGFSLRDRLGQTVFGDNTFLSYQHDTPRIEAARSLVATFSFRMPILPTGDYSFSAAVAEGTQDVHVQHHWMHEALIIRAQASSICFGVIGVPMSNITLAKL